MSNHPLFGGDEVGQARFDDARFVVLPAPLESTVSYGRGTGAGPAAILRASTELEFFDEESERPYWAPGSVHTLPALELPMNGEAAVDAIAAAAAGSLDADKFLLTLGGEHTITTGPVRAANRRHPDLAVVFFDAHLDLRDQYGGSPWSHACVARRIIDLGLPVEWCGIRSVAAEEHEFLQANGLRPFYAHSLDPEGRWIDDLVKRLPEKIYLSIDVDGLDPSVVPGTGTPEPGGLSYRQLLALIRTLTRRRRVVAADIVEVAPIPGQQVSEFTAARIAAKLMGAVAEGL